MFLFNNLNLKPDDIKAQLHKFEDCCLGKQQISPDDFKILNMELSINVVLNVGKYKFQSTKDGKHLLWTDIDEREHDLGLIDNINVIRNYPGFHKVRSLALGHNRVVNYQTQEVPTLRRQITYVEMEDGSTGIGPNYKMALRNAALRMHLGQTSGRLGFMNFKKYFHGNA